MLTGYTTAAIVKCANVFKDAIIFSTDNKYLSIVYKDLKFDFLLDNLSGLKSIVNDNKDFIYLGFKDGRIDIYSIDIQKDSLKENKIDSFSSRQDTIDSLVYHPLFEAVFSSCSKNNSIHMRNRYGKYIFSLESPNPDILYVNKYNHELYSANLDGSIKIFDSIRCDSKKIIHGSGNKIVSLEVFKDTIIVVLEKGIVNLYNSQTYNFFKRLSSYFNFSASLIYKDSLLLGTHGGIIKHFELPTLRHFKDTIRHDKKINLLKNYDGKIFSASEDLSVTIV